MLERKRYENRAREASVSVVRMAQPGACAVSETHSCVRAGGICASVQPLVDACHVSEERLSRTHYDLITAVTPGAFFVCIGPGLHLCASLTSLALRCTGIRPCVQTAPTGCGDRIFGQVAKWRAGGSRGGRQLGISSARVARAEAQTACAVRRAAGRVSAPVPCSDRNQQRSGRRCSRH